MSCGRCARWQPPARSGIQIPGTFSRRVTSPYSPRVSRILRNAVYKVLSGFGVLIYEGLTSLPRILRLVVRDLSECHMKNLTDQGYSFTVSAERQTLVRSRRNCGTLMGITTQCSNRHSRRRPASSQTGTSSLTTFLRAEVFFLQPSFNG